MSCILCGMAANIKLGTFLTKEDGDSTFSVHKYCLYFTPLLEQKDFLPQEILKGFCPKDIRKEAKRVSKESKPCFHCNGKQANLGCCAPKCKKNFHTLCGIENGASFDSQQYNSFCKFCTHKMNMSKYVKHPPTEKCLLCSDVMGKHGKLTSIKAVCCKKGWFHRSCIEKVAIREGIHFQCPICKDLRQEKLFTEVVKRCIFLPELANEDAQHKPNQLCGFCKLCMGAGDSSVYAPCCESWFHQAWMASDQKCPLCNRLVPCKEKWKQVKSLLETLQDDTNETKKENDTYVPKKEDESVTSETSTDNIAQSLMMMQDSDILILSSDDDEEEEEVDQEPHYSNLLPNSLPSPPPMVTLHDVSMNGTGSSSKHSEKEFKRKANESLDSDDQPIAKASKSTSPSYQNGEPYFVCPPPSNSEFSEVLSKLPENYLSEQSSGSITEHKSAKIINRMKLLQLRISSLFDKIDEFYTDMRQISSDFEVLCEEVVFMTTPQENGI